jgi:hypothetical protein
MPNTNDHTKLAVLETKVEYIEGAVKANSLKLGEIDNKVDGISTHIAKQNGALPGLERDMSTLLARLGENEKLTYKTNTKAKITWAILSALVTGLLVAFVKVFVGV